MGNLKLYCQKAVITPLVILAVLILFLVSMLRVAPPVEDGALSESFFPTLIFLTGAPVAVLLLIEGIKTARNAQSQERTAGKQGEYRKVFLVAAVILFLALTFELLGYVITAPIFVFLFMLIYDDKPQKIARKMLYTVLITAFVYVLYGIVFDVRFPQPWR
jgi:hypothetical protein